MRALSAILRICYFYQAYLFFLSSWIFFLWNDIDKAQYFEETF